MNDFDDVDRLLAEEAERQRERHMVEPIDEPDCSPFDYAEVTGLWDEMYPEPLDINNLVW